MNASVGWATAMVLGIMAHGAGIGFDKGCLENVGVETNSMAKRSATSAKAVSHAAEIKEL